MTLVGFRLNLEKKLAQMMVNVLLDLAKMVALLSNARTTVPIIRNVNSTTEITKGIADYLSLVTSLSPGEMVSSFERMLFQLKNLHIPLHFLHQQNHHRNLLLTGTTRVGLKLKMEEKLVQIVGNVLLVLAEVDVPLSNVKLIVLTTPSANSTSETVVVFADFSKPVLTSSTLEGQAS